MKDLIYKEAKIPFCAHKFFNLQIGYMEDEYYEYFDFNCKWTKNQDHAGFNLNLGSWRFYFIFYTYDNRHWDDENNKYFDGDWSKLDTVCTEEMSNDMKNMWEGM